MLQFPSLTFPSWFTSLLDCLSVTFHSFKFCLFSKVHFEETLPCGSLCWSQFYMLLRIFYVTFQCLWIQFLSYFSTTEVGPSPFLILLTWFECEIALTASCVSTLDAHFLRYLRGYETFMRQRLIGGSKSLGWALRFETLATLPVPFQFGTDGAEWCNQPASYLSHHAFSNTTNCVSPGTVSQQNPCSL